MAQQTRREFIKNSAKIGVALGAVAAFPSLLNAANFTANSTKNSQNLAKGNTMQNSNSAKNAANSNSNLAQTSQTQSLNSAPQVWFITGGSGGLGYALAKYLLEKGDKVAVTSRKKGVEARFKGLATSENFLPLVLTFDAKIDEQIKQNLAQIQNKFGRLDNVVNNAGYGLLGFVEEVSEKQLREQFEVNVFAPFLVAQNALKVLRPQALREGGSAANIKARIYNLSSIGGFRVSNVSTPYCMSKFALSALSEGLMLDAADFGIATINVMPAGFRTEFLGTSMNLGEGQIAAYNTKREAFLQRTKAYSGTQAGDPAKFAQIIYKTSRLKKPPFSLFMGDAAYKSARNKIAFVQEDMKATESYAGAAADFAGSAGSAFDKR